MQRLAPLVVALAACRAGNCAALCSFDGDAMPAYSVGAGTWKRIAAPDAPSSPNVLEQDASNGESIFNIALFDRTDVADVELGVKLKAIGGEIDRGGGLVWRARDARNYYVVRYNPLESNFRLYKVVDGVRAQIAGADAAATPGWHAMRVSMKGDAIVCELDGKVRLEATDATFPHAGRIGLWTKADARTQFDDLWLRGPGSGQIRSARAATE